MEYNLSFYQDENRNLGYLYIQNSATKEQVEEKKER